MKETNLCVSEMISLSSTVFSDSLMTDGSNVFLAVVLLNPKETPTGQTDSTAPRSIAVLHISMTDRNRLCPTVTINVNYYY